MKITGYEYLTFENLFNFVTNPLVILMLVLLILFMINRTKLFMSLMSFISLAVSYPRLRTPLRI